MASRRVRVDSRRVTCDRRSVTFDTIRFCSLIADQLNSPPTQTKALILGEHGEGAIKPWSLAQVTFEDDNFVHESLGTFFTHEGADKEFTLAQGLPWEGGDTFDDYC